MIVRRTVTSCGKQIECPSYHCRCTIKNVFLESSTFCLNNDFAFTVKFKSKRQISNTLVFCDWPFFTRKGIARKRMIFCTVIFARMLLTCHEKIWRVGRFGGECYEDASDCPQQVVCVSGSWNLENDTTHGQTGSTVYHSRPPADQSSKLNGDVAQYARHPRSILARMSRVSGVSARMSRGNCCRGIPALPLSLIHISEPTRPY